MTKLDRIGFVFIMVSVVNLTRKGFVTALKIGGSYLFKYWYTKVLLMKMEISLTIWKFNGKIIM